MSFPLFSHSIPCYIYKDIRSRKDRTSTFNRTENKPDSRFTRMPENYSHGLLLNLPTIIQNMFTVLLHFTVVLKFGFILVNDMCIIFVDYSNAIAISQVVKSLLFNFGVVR